MFYNSGLHRFSDLPNSHNLVLSRIKYDKIEGNVCALCMLYRMEWLSMSSNNKNEKLDLSEVSIIFYKTEDGSVKLEVYFDDEDLWLTQKKMAELFEIDVRTVNDHLKNIFESRELDQNSTIRKNRIVQKEGNRDVSREVNFYNLDGIIAVGYRINSKKATQFRQWATKTLTEYIKKGFVLDDELLKNGTRFGKDYFDELLERIREIRASERRFYQKITDIYAQCSYDYYKDAEISQTFYATVQNKLHWAITGHTAAELIKDRVNSSKENMGLTTWKNSPKGKVLKSDITVAKNYLYQQELSDLNGIVNMYLDYAENQAKRQKLMSMQDWVSRLDAFLTFNEYEILKDSGKVSREVAKATAEEEYEKYRKVQDKKFVSDFDREFKKYLE